MTKTELAKTGSAALPAYLQKMGGKPLQRDDNFSSDDVAIPRIKLLQGTSDEIGNFDGAVPGVFWHTGADMSLGKELNFVVAARNKKVLLIAPINDGQGILARSDDFKTWDRTGSWDVKIGKSKNDVATWEIDTKDVRSSSVMAWGTSDPRDSDSPPAATIFYDYFVLLPDHPELGLAVMSLARSQIKRAKRGLNDKIDMHLNNGNPMQAVVFVASPVVESSDAGDFFNYQFRQNGFAPEEIYNSAKELSAMVKTFKVADEAKSVSEGDAKASATTADSDEF